MCLRGVSPVRGMPLSFVLDPVVAGLIVISASLIVIIACCFWILDKEEIEQLNFLQ
jgi:hypothetical protein